jgi:stress response protein YsnF
LSSTSSSDNSDIQIVPVLEERYSIAKKVVTQDFTIEKRWVTKTMTFHVPVKYEEIFVNGKRFGSGAALEKMLSSLKETVSNKKESDEEKVNKKQSRLRGELVPLSNGNPKTQETLTLFGEEIIINRNIRRMGEAIISKRRVTENKKVKIDIKGERVIVRHPDGTEEEVRDKPFTAATSK